MIWLIYDIIRHFLIGAVTGAFTSLIIWTLVMLLKEGPTKTREKIKEMGPILSADGYSAGWFIKTGAIAGCILGMIAAPYLGPMLGRYLWQFAIPGFDANDIGSLVIGFASGIIGYLLRVP